MVGVSDKIREQELAVLTLRQPEWHQVNSVGDESSTPVDEFTELRHGLHQMALHEVGDPFVRLLTELRLQLDLEHAVLENLLVLGRKLIERKVDADIGATPVISSTHCTIPVVLANHSQFGVERYADAGIARKLESRTVVEATHDYVCRSSDKFVTIQNKNHAPGFSFRVITAYWTSFASWIIESTSAWVFLPFLTRAWNSASTVYSPRKKAFTRCSLIGNRAFTDFSPVQSSRWVLRSTNIYGPKQ